MKLLLRRAAAAVAAGAAVVALGAGSADASGYYSGTLQVGRLSGLPTTVRLGHTITVNLWFRQTSAYNVQVGSYGVLLFNPEGVNARGSSAPGVTVTWYNPFTKQWAPSDDRLSANSEQIWMVPYPHTELVRSGFWEHETVRINFASWVKPGVWHLTGYAPLSYSVLTKSGRGTSAILHEEFPALQTIDVVR